MPLLKFPVLPEQFFKGENTGYKVMVTGVAGFIDSNLCETSLFDADEICLNKFATRHRYNLDAFKDNPDFILNVGDILELDIKEY